jgi:hypothetical protein
VEIISCVTTQPNRISLIGFEVLAVVVIKDFIFRDIKQRCAYFYLLHDGVLLGLFIDHEYGGDMFHRNID